MMTDYEREVQWGLYRGYFWHADKYDPYKANLIRRMTYPKYIEYYYKLRDDIGTIYYTLVERRKLSDLYNKHMKDDYASRSSFNVAVGRFAFSNHNSVPKLIAIKKMQKLRKMYRRYYE